MNVVKFLVKNGATILAQDNDLDTPLHLAALKGRLDIVEFFVENQADVESKNVY